MKTTLRDIAERAQVSPATVSNALNDKGGVSDAVKARIFAIARELGYPLAGESKRQSRYVRMIIYRSHGLVVQETPFFTALAESIQSECRQSGLELTISHVYANRDEDFREQIRAFRAENCAGIILLATEMSPEELKLFSGCKAPLVVLDNAFPAEDVHSVVMNNREAGRLAARELVRAGRRSFGHITSSVPFRNNTERMEGFREGLAEFGIELPDEALWPVTPMMSAAYEDMKKLIAQRGALPEAFFAANDWMAIGSMRAITEAGYRVPEDVSIIGMDDLAVCEACTPQLTTLHVYRRELGAVVTRTLLSLIDWPASPIVKTTVGVKIVRRASVKYADEEIKR